jgi:hypothetical protein
MKKILNKKYTLILLILSAMTAVLATNGCKVNQEIADKSGAQLWGENCRRCHNIPDPGTFSDEKWITVGMHMQTRAMLTDAERDKIVDFLKQ